MEILAELEPEPRGIYTGAIGYVAPGGDAQFNVAIRTALIDERQRAHLVRRRQRDRLGFELRRPSTRSAC